MIERLRSKENLVVLLLLALYLATIVLSLCAVEISRGVKLSAGWTPILETMALACLLPVFVLADFSFGYIIGVGFYGTIAGFIWLSYSSEFEYDHVAARWSAALSLMTFLSCSLFQMRPAKRVFEISVETMERVLTLGLAAAVIVLVLDLRFGFAIVGMQEAERLRAGVQRPAFLNYLTSNFTHAILPFAFAFFVQRKHWVKAAVCLIIISSFYPVLLNKTVLLASAGLFYTFVVFRNFAPKQAAVICLLVPLLLGLLLHEAGASIALGKFSVFGVINERLFAIPSIALDRYAHFFTNSPNTYFCQINLVRLFVSCPYSRELGSIFADHYRLGNLNASLFATEGIASVGLKWMPMATFVCGVMLSVGNSVSRHLSPTFIATSSALAVQALMNVPLSIAVLTDGVGLLFVLWYICPGDRSSSVRLNARRPDNVVILGGVED